MRVPGHKHEGELRPHPCPYTFALLQKLRKQGAAPMLRMSTLVSGKTPDSAGQIKTAPTRRNVVITTVASSVRIPSSLRTRVRKSRGWGRGTRSNSGCGGLSQEEVAAAKAPLESHQSQQCPRREWTALWGGSHSEDRSTPKARSHQS